MSYFLSLSLYILLLSAGSLVLAIEDYRFLQRRSNSPITTVTEPFRNNTQPTISQYARPKQEPQNSPETPLYITGGPEDDYYYDDGEDPKGFLPSNTPMSPCSYDRCAHLSLTCEEIQTKTRGNCSCPGIDGPSRKPDPPNGIQVLPGEREISVNWCSPLSTVKSYKVLYQERYGQLKVGTNVSASYRSYSIRNLDSGTQYIVCVVAINDAGESSVEIDNVTEDTEEKMLGPCRVFYTSASKDSYVHLGLGLGIGALVLVFGIMGFLLYKRQKKKTSMIADQSYKSEDQL